MGWLRGRKRERWQAMNDREGSGMTRWCFGEERRGSSEEDEGRKGESKR